MPTEKVNLSADEHLKMAHRAMGLPPPRSEATPKPSKSVDEKKKEDGDKKDLPACDPDKPVSTSDYKAAKAKEHEEKNAVSKEKEMSKAVKAIRKAPTNAAQIGMGTWENALF